MFHHKIKHRDFYKSGLKLAFVPQTSNGEISILIPAKFLINKDMYPKSQDRGMPASLSEWNHPWPIEEGFARLRLSELNNDDGLTYCNFNMNKGNLSDYENISGYYRGYLDQIIRKSLETNEETRKTVNNLVDMSRGMVYMDNETNSFVFNIWDAYIGGHCRVVRTRKFVFCIVPKSPTALKSDGVEYMIDTKVDMFHHAHMCQDKVRIGWKDGVIKVPCVDGGGLSNICIDNDAIYSDTFTPHVHDDPPPGAASEPGNISAFSPCIIPYIYLGKESFNQIYTWAKLTWNRYMESRGVEPYNDEKFGNLFKSVMDLYNEY